MSRFGFDISFYQDNDLTLQTPDFEKMRGYGAEFVIIRAGQGSWEDPDFKTNWKNAKGILPRHSYWFYDNRYAPRMQARLWWNLVKDDFEGIMWLDLEHVKPGSYTGWRYWFDFLDELIRVIGVPKDRVGIYTGYYYWTSHLPPEKSLAWFGQFKLWLAWYAENSNDVEIPHPWTKMFLWQDGTYPVGPLAGVESREIDHDFFMGTDEEFLEFFGEITSPPDGENMTILYYADLKSGLTSNVRTAPTLSANTGVQQITGPLTVSIISEKTVADGYDWYQISYPVSGWIALTGSYTNFRPADTTPPPTSQTADVTAVFPDGTIWKGTITKQ